MKYVQGNVPHVSNILAKFIKTVGQGTSHVSNFFFSVLVGKATSLPTQIQTNRTAATLVMSYESCWFNSWFLFMPLPWSQFRVIWLLCFFVALTPYLQFFSPFIECCFKKRTVRGCCKVWETLKLDQPWMWSNRKEKNWGVWASASFPWGGSLVLLSMFSGA